MLQYHSISHIKKTKLMNTNIYSFYKYDGSNLRFEWQPKNGFSKFGTRTQMMNEQTEIFGEGITIFQDKLSKNIIENLKNFYSKKDFNNFSRIVVFCEFFGKNSFAGNHQKDDDKELKLFDVHLFKKGFIPPQDFVELFKDLPEMAELLYTGKLNDSYISSIQENTENILDEGVICKGIVKNQVEMVKIKTNSWLNKIKGNFTNWEDLV